jgi:hypothetical protein
VDVGDYPQQRYGDHREIDDDDDDERGCPNAKCGAPENSMPEPAWLQEVQRRFVQPRRLFEAGIWGGAGDGDHGRGRVEVGQRRLALKELEPPCPHALVVPVLEQGLERGADEDQRGQAGGKAGGIGGIRVERDRGEERLGGEAEGRDLPEEAIGLCPAGLANRQNGRDQVVPSDYSAGDPPHLLVKVELVAPRRLSVLASVVGSGLQSKARLVHGD